MLAPRIRGRPDATMVLDPNEFYILASREAVSIPVVVNGDVRSGDDARRALAETGCAGAR